MRLSKCFIYAVAILMIPTMSFPARIKDIASIEGIRDNQLVGYGLVMGLDGTGDVINQAPFTDQTFKNMLLQFGIKIPFDKVSQLKNVAAVAISAKLPPFAKIGQKIDVTILSLGNAVSLRGGSLLMTPLKGADGKIYAIAQGSVVVSGFGAHGSDGSKVIVNVTSSGTIPNGATVEATIDTPFVQHGEITYELIHPDFTTATRIEKAINDNFGYKVAEAQDAGTVTVNFHHLSYKENYSADDEKGDRRRYVPLIARIENIEFSPAEIGARVIANSRTGTIVIGQNVTISPVAGASSAININQQNGRAFIFAPGPSLNDVVDIINHVGASPGDLISILEAIKAAGALNADLEII
jgi:flagellar P-ring protein precursor FlgI